jgi:hypothetical protein
VQLGLATVVQSLESALEGAGRALVLAEVSQNPILVSAAFEADAIVLGALQRVASVRSLSTPAFSGARVCRRYTTGTEAELRGGVVYHALALPKVSALFPDASARTLLNRNLRLFMKAYMAAGVPFRYFGTEVLSVLGHPVALVGYDQSSTGAVLIEVFIGVQSPCVVRPALKREAPSGLAPLIGGNTSAGELLERALAGVVERSGVPCFDASAALTGSSALAPPTCLELETSQPAQVVVPIGIVEASLEPSPRISGDFLGSVSAVSLVEADAASDLASGRPFDLQTLQGLQGQPLDGARPADLLTALQQARGTG